MPDNKTNNKIVSVVIAAYNEEPRIANVLNALKNHPYVHEVIVVDDCSKDKTSAVAAGFGVNVVRNEHNLGKTMSVKKGIDLAKGEVIALLDADLIGITAGDLTKLMKPVVEGEYDWTISLRSNSWIWMKWVKMDWVSGERVVRKELLADPLIWSRPEVGFGLETLMNMSLLNKKTKFQSVYLANLKTERKADKFGFFVGWYKDFKMVFKIFSVLWPGGVIAQFVRMAILNEKYKNEKLSS